MAMTRLSFVACLASLCVPVCAAEPGLLPPIEKGLRVFTCGHSFHVFSYPQVRQMAQAAGLQQQEAGISSIGGSMVKKHWDVPDEKNLAKTALKEGRVDVLTLSPIWLPDEGIENFAKLAVQHNPDIRITVQEFWLPNDEYVPVYPLQTKKEIDHNAAGIPGLSEANTRYENDIEAHLHAINERLGRNTLVVVPVGRASIALRKKIISGEAPGLKAQWDLFRDTWGHANPPLQILASYCHFAVIYRRSPVGLPVPLQFKALKMSDDEKTKLNLLLQELAWDAVSHHPMAGVMAAK